MTVDFFYVLAWLMAVSSGLMAGVYLAFFGGHHEILSDAKPKPRHRRHECHQQSHFENRFHAAVLRFEFASPRDDRI